jgi:predicted nuclease with TOPRIM domain
MTLPIIISEFKKQAVERSELLKKIREMENEVTSITERLSDLSNQKQNSDQVQRAKDKRKHLREQIAELEHQVRLKDVTMQEIWMTFRWRLEENV